MSTVRSAPENEGRARTATARTTTARTTTARTPEGARP